MAVDDTKRTLDLLERWGQAEEAKHALIVELRAHLASPKPDQAVAAAMRGKMFAAHARAAELYNLLSAVNGPTPHALAKRGRRRASLTTSLAARRRR